MTYAEKFKTILNYDCQLISKIDSKGDYFIGYAFQTDGFPVVKNKHPCFTEEILMKDIEEVEIEGAYLKLTIKNQKKKWEFAFFSHDFMILDWL